MIHPWAQIDSVLFYLIIAVSASMSLNLYFRGDTYLCFSSDTKGYWVHQISTILVCIAIGTYAFKVWPAGVPVFLIAGLPIGLVCGFIWLVIFNPIYEIYRR